MSKQTQEMLIKANTIFNNITDNAGAKAVLAEYGYDDARLAAGMAIFAAAKTASEQNIKEYSDRYAASATYQALRKTAYKTFMNHTKLARLALANTPAAYNQLGLVGTRGTSFAKISEQVSVFYTAVLSSPSILALLLTFGLTEAKLSAGQAAFAAAQVAHAEQQRNVAEAVNSTAARDVAISALSAWVSAFIATAQIALEDQPEVWATLGV